MDVGEFNGHRLYTALDLGYIIDLGGGVGSYIRIARCLCGIWASLLVSYSSYSSHHYIVSYDCCTARNMERVQGYG